MLEYLSTRIQKQGIANSFFQNHSLQNLVCIYQNNLRGFVQHCRLSIKGFADSPCMKYVPSPFLYSMPFTYNS